MRVIAGYIFPEPPENVLQGACIGDWPLGQQTDESWRLPVLQGKSANDMPGYAVPRAMIGWNPYFAMPKQIGPMAIQGGSVGMVSIGPASAPNPIIDSTQRFLSSALPLDSTGAWFPQDDVVIGGEVPMSGVLNGENALAYPTPLTNPRREVTASGSLKVLTAPTLPDFFGQKVYSGPISYQRFALTGQTLDSSSASLAGCRVVAMESGRMTPIAETVSDGGGNYTLPARNIDYQLIAYKPGSPDVAGVSRNDVTPTVV